MQMNESIETCFCSSLIPSNFTDLHRVCAVRGDEQDLFGKYLQWFVRSCVLSRLVPFPSYNAGGEVSHLTALQVVHACRKDRLMDSKDLTPAEAGLSLPSCLYISECPQLSVQDPEAGL